MCHANQQIGEFVPLLTRVMWGAKMLTGLKRDPSPPASTNLVKICLRSAARSGERTTTLNTADTEACTEGMINDLRDSAHIPAVDSAILIFLRTEQEERPPVFSEPLIGWVSLPRHTMQKLASCMLQKQDD